MESALRGGIQQARFLSRSHATERLLIEAQIERGLLPADVFSVEIVRDTARARTYAQSYAERWLKHAEGETTRKAVTTANTETLGSLKRIAVTESSEAYNTGKATAAKSVPKTGMLRVWDANLDKRSCMVCQRADGYIVGLKEPFPWGEPGTVHPYCRCTFTILSAVDSSDELVLVPSPFRVFP